MFGSFLFFKTAKNSFVLRFLLFDAMTELQQSWEENKDGIAKHLKEIAEVFPGKAEWKVEVLPNPNEGAKAVAASGSSSATIDRFWRTIAEFLMKVSNDIRYGVDDLLKVVLLELASKRVIAFQVDESVPDRSLKAHFEDGKLVFGICAKYFNHNEMMYQNHIEEVIKEYPSVALAASYNESKDGIAKHLKEIAEGFPGKAKWKVEVLPNPSAAAKAAAASGSSYATIKQFWRTIAEFLMKVSNDIRYGVDDLLKVVLLELASKRVIAFQVDESITDHSLKAHFEEGKLVFGVCAKYFNYNDMMYENHIQDMIRGQTKKEQKSSYSPSSVSYGYSVSSGTSSSSLSAAKKPCSHCLGSGYV